MLQFCCSEDSPEHAVPPFSSCVSTFLVLTCTPPPQVLLHFAHVSHDPHAQFTKIEILLLWTDTFLYHINLNILVMLKNHISYILGGQIWVLHSVFSVPVCNPSKLLPPPVIPSQGIPPYASCVLIKRLRNLIPPPHVTVQDDHKFHSWYSQSIGQCPSTIEL